MFSCTKCGLCCKNIDKIPQLSAYDRGDGRCIYLTELNLCKIYAKRPDICNVEKMYDLVYCKLMSRKEYDKINAEGCKTLQLMEKNYYYIL